MSGWSEWPIKPVTYLELDYPVTPMKARMDAVYQARISPTNSASEAFDIGWGEGHAAGASDIEDRFWSMVDRAGLSGLPSDMFDALETLVNNRESLRDMRLALHDAINSPKGVVPASAEQFYDAASYRAGEVGK